MLRIKKFLFPQIYFRLENFFYSYIIYFSYIFKQIFLSCTYIIRNIIFFFSVQNTLVVVVNIIIIITVDGYNKGLWNININYCLLHFCTVLFHWASICDAIRNKKKNTINFYTKVCFDFFFVYVFVCLFRLYKYLN